MTITSKENSKIKYINKLKDKKNRDKENKFIIETQNLIEEVEKEGILLEVYTTKKELNLSCPVYNVTEEVMDKIKNIKTSNILGICSKKEEKEIKDKILLLDGVQDPGNLGTIIRSSVAFGIETIILSEDSCDLYNDKVIRASEGALFKINIIRGNLKEKIEEIRKKEINIYGTNVANGIDVSKIKKDKYAIIIGSEGNGVKKEIESLVDKNIYIKTKKVESLNVAVATSIILYELSK